MYPKILLSLICATSLSSSLAHAEPASVMTSSGQKTNFFTKEWDVANESSDKMELSAPAAAAAEETSQTSVLPVKEEALLGETSSETAPPPAKDVSAIKPVMVHADTQIGKMTLDKALEKALAQSPRLKAAGSGVASAKGELRQSNAWTNPEIDVEAENFAGDGPYKGFDSAEVTVGVSQEIQIGGKIAAREGIATKGLEIASLDQKATALDIIRDVTIAYADVVAAEENVRLASEQKELADDVLKSVNVRVNAAAAPFIQKSRAEVERSTAAIALDEAISTRDISRKKFALLMGEENFGQSLDTSDFYAMSAPESSKDGLKANPDLAKLNSGLEQSKARLELEQAGAIPDPRVSVGMRDFRDTGDRAFVMGLALPIPVFNANRGNIEKARHDITRTEMDNRSALLNANAELMQAEQQMQNAHRQAEMLRTDVLPSADKAFRLSREGYGLGRFPYLEVLDAQRSLFGVKQQQIEAIRKFHTAKAQIERLTATRLNDIKTGESHAE